MTESQFASHPVLGEIPRFKTACRTCRDRKVKCEKVQPCHNCTVAGIVCSFPPQVRTVRRPKRVGALSTGREDRSFIDRFNQLEELLKRHAPHLLIGDDNRRVKSSREEHQEAGESSISEQHKSVLGLQLRTVPLNLQLTDTVEAELDNDEPQWSPSSFSMASQTLQSTTTGDYSDISYWTQLEKECADSIFINTSMSNSRGALGSPGVTASADQSQPASNNAQPRMGFPFQQPVGIFSPSLPPLKQRQVCWSRFVENIDPMVKILHKPTIESLISVHDPHRYRLNPSIGALIQAICLLAVASMSEDDISANLEEEKEGVVQNYTSLTEQALQAANFLDARDLNTVQALLLYLYYLKHKGDSRLYGLCGVAIHLAKRMGFNRNIISPEASCLEIELRRRLWWQLLTLVDHPDDFSADCTTLCVDIDAKLPLNLNDYELELPDVATGDEHDGFTESSFCLMQYEITRAFNQIRFERSLISTDQSSVADNAEYRLHSTRRIMEARYFRYSSADNPINKFAAHAVAMILAKRRLLIHISPAHHQQSNPLTPGTCDRLFLLGIHVLELSRALQTARQFKRWRWLAVTYFQWSAATFVVGELVVRPQSPATRRAWHVVNGILDDWPEVTRCSDRAVQLKNLTANAARNRDAGNIWNIGVSPVSNTNDQHRLPSETTGRKAAAGEKRGETQANYDQQPSSFSPLGQEMDFEKYVVSEMSFNESAFGTDHTFT